MTTSKNLLSLALASVFLLGLSGCGKREAASGEGPAEKVGQKIDQAADKAAQEINKMTEKAGNAMEKAGESMQDKARQAQQDTTQK